MIKRPAATGALFCGAGAKVTRVGWIPNIAELWNNSVGFTFMGIVDHKLAMLRRLERLHRVRRRRADDVDLETVIAELEVELGETVSQRIAARFLGVSHTALGRWVRAGQIPLVESRAGRNEVPVPALLRLKESGHRDGGERPDRMVAECPVYRQGPSGESHAEATDRALAYHRALARRLTRKHVEDASYRLRKWGLEGKLDPAYQDRWDEILRGSLSEIQTVLVEDSPDAADLRQNSPFAGLISEPERRALIGAPAR